MKIEDLIDERNNQLYQHIKEHFDVVLEENKDWRAEAWDTKTRNGATIILHCPTPFPSASFTKELLRIQAQIRGFRPVVSGLSLSSLVNERMQTIIKSLNHHFLNHKTAREFAVLGYPPEQFQDDDGGTLDFLRDQLHSDGHSALMLSLMYLSFIEPLMSLSKGDKHIIQNLFDQYDGGKFRQYFERIDNIIRDWAENESYDAEEHMVDFLTNAGINDTWLCYKSDSQHNAFPENGFFVGEPFDRNVEF